MAFKRFDQSDKTDVSYYEYTPCDGGPMVHVDQGTNVIYRRRGATSGARTPKYHQKVKLGQMLPLNSYYRWDYEMSRGVLAATASCCPQTGKRTYFMYNRLVPGDILWDESEDSPDTSYDIWEGVNTDALVIAAMADILPDLDALTTAIESRQTINMVVNARSEAKRLISEALRGGKHTVKAASDAWLAWRYGWEQLGRDVANCYELIKEPTMPLVVTGQSGESRIVSESIPASSGGTAEYWNPKYSVDISRDISIRARVIAKWRVETLNAIADPAISAWETIPYSFVADWFVNVGDVLAAWKVQNNVSSIYASLGSKYTARAVTVQTADPGTCPSNSVSSGSMTRIESYRSKTRFPTSIPSLGPSFTVRLTSKRIADAAALLAKRIL